MLGSRETDLAGPRCKGSDARHAPVGYRRELVGHEADARGTSPQQIAIGMLNDVKCGHLIKILWHDGIYAKTAGARQVYMASSADGTVSIIPAQLAYMLDGIDWRNPVRTWRPEAAG